MLSLRLLVTLAALAAASIARAQSGPMLTPSASIKGTGHLGLDVFAQTIGKEPNYLTFAERGLLHPRTRIDGPVLRLTYVPSERAEFAAEFVSRTFAVKDPRFGSVSDFGDATLRAKLGLAKGEAYRSPAVAVLFEVTLPNTSFGDGLGPNTLRMESDLVVGYQTDKLTLNGKAGLAIQDEPLRPHEQRDFLSLTGSVAYKVSEGFEAFADAGGFFGNGVPGAIAKREVRAGVQNHRTMFGYPTSFFVAGRRGLVEFSGKWGVVVGFSTTMRQGMKP